jgi:hypothetical protein
MPPSTVLANSSNLVDATLAWRRGQAGHDLLWVLDRQDYSVVFAVSQVDDYPRGAAVADGEGDALVLMTFWRALSAGGQGSCCRPAIDPGLMLVMACWYVAGWRGAVIAGRHRPGCVVPGLRGCLLCLACRWWWQVLAR